MKKWPTQKPASSSYLIAGVIVDIFDNRIESKKCLEVPFSINVVNKIRVFPSQNYIGAVKRNQKIDLKFKILGDEIFVRESLQNINKNITINKNTNDALECSVEINVPEESGYFEKHFSVFPNSEFHNICIYYCGIVNEN